MANESSLKIQQFTVDFTFSHWGTAAHQKNLRRFQNAIKPGMQTALTTALQALDNNSEQLLFIKKIDVDCVLDLQAEQGKLFNHWANALKNKLAILLRKKQSNQVVIFESSQDYCAQFLRALITGNAWQQWYFRSFDGLKSLPLSVAIRTLLIDEQQPAMAAVAKLNPAEIAQLCTLLSQADCRIILSKMSSRNTKESVFDIQAHANLLKNIFALLDKQVLSSAAQTQLYLIFCGNLIEGTHLIESTNLLHLPEASITALVELKTLEHTLGEQKFLQLLQALHQRDANALRALLNPIQYAALAWLIAQPVTGIHAITQALQKSSQQKIPVAPAMAARFTRFGNVLFLLYQLNNLPLQQWCKDWPSCEGASAEAVIKLLSVCTCQGIAKFGSAFKDSVVQDLCGVRTNNKYPLSMAQVLEWLDVIGTEQTAQAKQQFHDFFYVAIAAPQGMSESAEWTIETQQAQFTIQGERKKSLWSNIQYRENIAPNNQIPVLDELDPSSTDMHLVITDLQFLWPSPNRSLPLHSTELICVLAQYALRSFACRLPGFAHSSANYLLNNFLSMTLTLSEKEQHFSAKISRVPMSVILNMTGITRSALHLPAFAARPLHLHEVDG